MLTYNWHRRRKWHGVTSHYNALNKIDNGSINMVITILKN